MPPCAAIAATCLGVFCACTEITKAVRAKREHAAERDRLREMFALSPSFVAVLRGPEHRFELTNTAYLQLIAHRDVIGMIAFANSHRRPGYWRDRLELP